MSASSGATITVAPDEQAYERPRGRSRRRWEPRPVRRVAVITLAPNPAQNGLQIYFPGKPDETLRTELKGAGWRWSSWNVCWYHRNAPENLTWATAFIARHGGVSEIPPDKIVPMVPSRGSVPPEPPAPVAEVIQFRNPAALWRQKTEGQPGGSR